MARRLHPKATLLELDPNRPETILPRLSELQPRYAMLLLLPDEIDVSFAWRWLRVSTRLDDDPLVDVACGIVTGVDDRAALALLERTRAACRGELALPAALVDDYGPNSQLASDAFQETRSNFMLPVYSRGRSRVISHGSGGLTRLDRLKEAGLVHIGGHGIAQGVVDGLQVDQLKSLELNPCVVFSGACYTGVTRRWTEPDGKQRLVTAEHSFCLQLLRRPVLGYLAALHADHGMPVYQELEFLTCRGGSLGEVMRATQNGVVLACGGHLPPLSDWAKASIPAEIMLCGTGSRVLFGDPSLQVVPAGSSRAFGLSQLGPLHFRARYANPQLVSTYLDTYHSDLGEAPFNDRFLLDIELPPTAESFRPEVLSCRRWFRPIHHRLVGWALEKQGRRRTAHILVDLASLGLSPSPLARLATELEFKLQIPSR